MDQQLCIPGISSPGMTAVALLLVAFVALVLNGARAFRPPRLLVVKNASSRLHSTLITKYETMSDLDSGFDYKKSDKLPWLGEKGYKKWTYKTSAGAVHQINFIDLGKEEGKKKKPLLLIHGFGAICYHWRYNIPILARDYHVYAIDLLGFGLSDKPVQDYPAEVWRDQAVAFIKEVIYPETKEAVTVAGNSLGGFTALYTAASLGKELVNGCILINAAGRFRGEVVEKEEDKTSIAFQLKKTFQKFVIGLSFVYTKQPLRIKQVLKQVYPVSPDMVDDDLVESIQIPALNKNAAEVFYRVITSNGNGPATFTDDLLKKLSAPLLLLWGSQDPWIRPSSADRIQTLLPSAIRINVEAGHCGHDEKPKEFNEEIKKFMELIK